MISNSALLQIGIPAGVSIAVTALLVLVNRARQFKWRRRRLESSAAVEAVTTASAAIDAAATSLKKMIEAVPGTTSAFTGRSATTAIETTTRAILTILSDQPARMQDAELAIRKLELGLAEMRELFNRLGNK